MIKHTQTIRRFLLTNCLNVFDHFVGLALKELRTLLHDNPLLFSYSAARISERCENILQDCSFHIDSPVLNLFIVNIIKIYFCNIKSFICCINQKQFCKNVFAFKNFIKISKKHPCWSLFLNKVAGLKSETLFKKILQKRCFPVIFTKFLRILVYMEDLRWLLLHSLQGMQILKMNT